VTVNYLKEKIGLYAIELEYLFPVNQTRCLGENEQFEATVDNPLTSLQHDATVDAEEIEPPIGGTRTELEDDGNWIQIPHDDEVGL